MTTAAARPRVVAGLRLIRLVGHGGEGEVWEARTSAGDARALKLIRPDALVAPDEVERRGRWLRAVDHSALVAVRRSGLLAGGGLDGWAFVEMPFLDGPSLEGAAADPEALARLRPLAEALDALHAGVWSDGVPLVHRDVKPANLIDVGDRLVLVDHSTLRDASAETVTRIGTPVFAAPEVPLGRAGPEADIYAFAATAVALLTGARGSALAALLEEPGRLDVPDGVRAALAADPRQRPGSCRDALDEPPVVIGGAAGEPPWRRSPTLDLAPAPVRAGEAPAAPGPVWRWILVLAVVAAAPAGALALGLPVWPDLAAAAAGAAVLHLLAHAVAGGPPALAILVPPLAWAWLLADRAAASARRRAYARAVLTGTLAAGTAVAAWGLLADGDRTIPLLAVAGSLVLVVAGVVAARRGGLLVQVLVLPAWLAGAALLVVAAVGLSPLAVVAGRGAAALRLAWLTLASAVEALRRPVAPPGALF